MPPLPERPSDDVVIAASATARTALLGAELPAAVIVAALYFGRSCSCRWSWPALLAFVLAPACASCSASGCRGWRVLVVAALAFGAIGGIGLVVGASSRMLAGSLPSYESTVVGKWHALSTEGGADQRLLQARLPAAAGAPTGDGGGPALGMANRPAGHARRWPAAARAARHGRRGLVFTVFILLSSEDLRDRLVRLVGRRDLHRTILAMNDAARRLSRFFLFQLALNTASAC